MRLVFILISLFISLELSFGQEPDYYGWVDRSIEFIENDQLDSAAVALYEAMSLEPANEHNPVLLLNLGILQRQLGQYDNAYVSFTAALTRNPLTDIVLHNRASLLIEMGRLPEAMDDYNAIIKDFPDDVEALYRRGLLHLENGDREKAEIDFKRSEEIDPENRYTKLSKALIFKLNDNWEAAERVYTDLIENEADPDPIFYLNRAECYVMTERTSSASEDLMMLGDTQRDNPYFYFLRGRVRLGQFDRAAARSDFNRAKELGYDPVIADEWLKRAN